MSGTTAEVAGGASRLGYLPVGMFGSVMGLTGLSVAWRVAVAQYTGLAHLAPVAPSIGIIALLTFLVLAAGYSVKAISAFHAVQEEFRHPIAGNLFGTVLISSLLLPIVLVPYSLLFARILWIAGAIGMILFAWVIVCRWMSDRQQAAHATPAWIIPVVGLLDVPLALPVLELPPIQGLVVFALAVGLFFAVPLFTLIFSRLLFEPPLQDSLKPSLMILVAPFAVGYSAYMVGRGHTEVDLFSEGLYMLMLFVLSVLLGQLRHLAACCPFRVSWWAVSFPLAASAIAALRFAAAAAAPAADLIAWILLGLATLIIAGLFARTLVGLFRGELQTLSGS